MPFSFFEDILLLSKPFAVDWEKAEVANEVMALKTQLDGMICAIPDEKEELQEEQEMWCVQWQALVVSNTSGLIYSKKLNVKQDQVHTIFQGAYKIGVSMDLNDELPRWMREANAIFR